MSFGEFTFVLLISAIAGIYILVLLIKFAAKELGKTLEHTTIHINIENKDSEDKDIKMDQKEK